MPPLKQQVAAQARELAVLLAISQTLAATLVLQPEQLLAQLCQLVACRQGVLFVLKETALVALVAWGVPLPNPCRVELHDPSALASWFVGQQPQRLAEIRGSTFPARALRQQLGPAAPGLLAEVRAWMWVPLAVAGQFIGAIGLAHTLPSYFTAHHANLALTVANQVAPLLAQAELLAQAQALAALQERQRLAQNLHDAINQSLFSAGLIVEVLPRLWERDQAAGRRALADVRRLTRGALAEMRLLLVDLRPMALVDTELGDSLRSLAEALMGRMHLQVVVNVSGQADLPIAVQEMFYRLCQEALNNVAKHAAATQVTIALQYAVAKDVVELRLHDDGCGFDPLHIPPGHYGLSMMRERATAVGATLLITSQPGQGTTLLVRWAKAL